MTKYHSRAEINQNTARMDLDDRRDAKNAVHDPSPARDFAAASLWTPETRAMPVSTASDMGVLALAIVGHVLAPLKEAARRDAKAAQEGLLSLFKALEAPDARTMAATVRDLKGLTSTYRLVLESRAGRRGMKLNSQYFGASVTAFQSGYDGHWITREAALRLRLVRYYEKTSGAFAGCVHRAMAALSRNGTAYAAWSAGWPVFVCDLNRTLERYAAQELMRAAQGRLVVVSRPVSAETQSLIARYAPDMVVVSDEEGLFAALIGNYGTVMLLERRIGGWTVTFPAGGAAERELKNKKYPGFARALARCASLPAALRQMQAERETEGKNRSDTVQESASAGHCKESA